MAYISKIKVPGNLDAYLIKDNEGRLMIAPAYYDSIKPGSYYVQDGKLYEAISNGTGGITGVETTVGRELQSIKKSISGAMHYIGITQDKLIDGAHNPELKPLPNRPTSLTKQQGFVAGDVVLSPSDVDEMYYEYVWNGEEWSKFGSTNPIGSMAYANEAKGTNTIEYKVPVYTGGTISVNEYSGDDESAVYIKPTSVVGSVEVATTKSASSVKKKNKYLDTTWIHQSGDSAVSYITTTQKGLATTKIYGVDETTVDASKVTDGEELIRVGATAKTSVVIGLTGATAAAGYNPFVSATVDDNECLSWIEKSLGTTEIREAFNENITVQKVEITNVTGIATKAQTGTTVATGELSENTSGKSTLVSGITYSEKMFCTFTNSSHRVATGALVDEPAQGEYDIENIADVIEVTPVEGLVTGLSVTNKDNVLQEVGSGETGATGLLTGLKSEVREFQAPVVKNGNETYSVDTEITVRPYTEAIDTPTGEQS